MRSLYSLFVSILDPRNCRMISFFHGEFICICILRRDLSSILLRIVLFFTLCFFAKDNEGVS